MRARIRIWLLAVVLSFSGALVSIATAAEPTHRIPVIYCTDLFHPHDDPDDHFDLATMYVMPELDIKGIVLDQGKKQLEKPGRIPVSQLNHITGRNVPAVIGLADPLKSPQDKALEQPAQCQQGVELILTTLRKSTEPVRIAAVGSMRDVVAAFNREPELFRTNVTMILAFIGEGSDPNHREYNVQLDPQAYVGLLRSGLPVYWVPCFDGGVWQNKGHASFCRAKQEDLLRQAAPEVLQYFIYALNQEKSDPLAFLNASVDATRRDRLFAGPRNLWCTVVLGALSGRQVVSEGSKYISMLPPKADISKPFTGNKIFGFSEVELTISDSGVVHYGPGPDSKKVMRFELRDPAHYQQAIVEATADLLSKLGRQKRTD
jgi:hypothetical protein